MSVLVVDVGTSGLRAAVVRADGEVDGSLFHVELKYPETDIDPGSEHNWRILTYVGPKDWSALETAGHSLEEVVSLTAKSSIARSAGSIRAYV